MTSSKFVKHFAETADISQVKAKEFLKALEAATVSYLSEMEVGDSVKVADVTYKVVEVPERSGVDHLRGTGAWTKPAHNTVRPYVSPSIKESVL